MFHGQTVSGVLFSCDRAAACVRTASRGGKPPSFLAFFSPYSKCGAATMSAPSHLRGWSLVKTGQGQVESVFAVHEGA